MFEQVKNSVDIVAHIGQYTQLRPGGGKALMGKCPLHDEKHPSFAVYPENGSLCCFGGCSSTGNFAGGTVIDFEMRRQNVSAGDAARYPCEQDRIVLSQDDVERYRRTEGLRQMKRSIMESIPASLTEQPEAARWLADVRKFSQATVAEFGLGVDDRLNAIVVPIMDRYGRPCAFPRRFLAKGPKTKRDKA